MDILFIQLTDIHIKFEEELDLLINRAEAISTAIKSLIYDDETMIFMCITGDVAFSGKDFQYTIAQLFFETISSHIEKDYKQIIINYIIVPGNHDCDFDSETVTRSLLLDKSSVNNTRQEINSNEIIKTCNDIQENYFNFINSSNPNTLGCTNNRIISEHIFNISTNNNYKIRFQCINTSITSKKKENPGDLLFKTERMEQQFMSQDADIVITLMHHDVHWFDWDSERDLTEYIQTSSDVVFAGHDHKDDYFLKSNYDESTNYVIKGNLLFDSNNQNTSGFNALRINSKKSTQNFYSFILTANGNYDKYKETGTVSFVKNRYSNSNNVLDIDFYERLLDLEVDLPCRSKKKLNILDIYTYPTLVYSEEDKLHYYRTKEEIIDLIEDKNEVIIKGEKEKGKTSLLKKMFLDLLERGFNPVSLNKDELDSGDGDRLSKLIKKTYMSQYKNFTNETLSILPKEKKVCIIDNFNEIKISDEGILSILKYLHAQFNCIIITSNNHYQYNNYLKNVRSNKYIKDNYYNLSINFSNYNRCKLIKSWVNVDKNLSKEESDLIYQDKKSKLETIMKKGYFNRTPIDSLLILSHLDSTDKIDSSLSKYSYIYETIVKKSIISIAKDNNNEAIKYQKILEMLSWEIFNQDNDQNEFSSELLSNVINDYFNTYRGKNDLFNVQHNLIRFKIIKLKYKEGIEYYNFNYNYMYYYFIGCYISEISNYQHRKSIIDKIFIDLSKDANYNIAIFLAYKLNLETDVLPVICNTFNNLFKEYKDYTYEQQYNLVKKLDMKITEIINSKYKIPNNEQIPLIEEKRLKKEEENEVKEKITLLYDEDNINNSNNEISQKDDELIDKDFYQIQRLMDVIGEILKNFSAGIKKEPVALMINTIHHSHLKLIGYMENTVSTLLDEIIESLEEDLDNNKSNKVKIEFVKSHIGHLWNMLMASSINQMAFEIDSIILEEDLNNYRNKNLKEEVSITYLTFLLKTAEYDLPIELIKKIYNDPSLSEFSKNVIKTLVAHHLTTNLYQAKDKQKICDVFNFPYKQYMITDHKLKYATHKKNKE